MAKSPEKAPAPEALDPSSGRLTVTNAQAALLLGVSRSTFDRMVKDGVFSVLVPARGPVPARFDAPAIVQAYIALRENRASELDASQEKALLSRAQRERIELEMQVKRRDVVPLADVQEAWTQEATAVREAVLAIPGQLVAAGLVDRSRERAIAQAVRDALTALSSRGDLTP